ncbi:MAG: hypothetical protein JWO09_2615 [Bacteroidetes bacterium]|nr:hypothetical protein [Bacteroidota bacterium]
MRYTFLSFILLLSVSMLAQSKGYMGKRFIISLSGMYMPATEPTARKLDGFKLNTTHTAGIEFVAGNETSLCASAGYFKTGLGFSQRSYTSNNYGVFYDGNKDVPITISIRQYSIGIKKFRRGAVAPLGIYLKWELIYQQGTVDFNKDNFFILTQSSTGVLNHLHPSSGSIPYNAFGAGFSLGFQRVFYDRMVLDYGIRGSITADRNGFFGDYVEREIVVNAYNRVAGHQLLNFRIAIGFLAF